MAQPQNPLGPITWGIDWNFFQKLTVTATNFNTNADIFIPFSTYEVTFQLEGATGSVEYSFNGTTIHGDMNAGDGYFSNNLTFTNRVISKIWFKGSGTVRIEAWPIR